MISKLNLLKIVILFGFLGHEVNGDNATAVSESPFNMTTKISKSELNITTPSVSSSNFSTNKINGKNATVKSEYALNMTTKSAFNMTTPSLLKLISSVHEVNGENGTIKSELEFNMTTPSSLNFSAHEIYGDNDTKKSESKFTMDTTPVELLERIKGRIVNGEKATSGQFPYMVSIQNLDGKGHFCGGALLTLKWVITAAHCLYRQNSVKKPLQAVAGEINIKLSYSRHRQTREVKKQIINPMYDYNMLTNDIGLLLLDLPFLPTSYIAPISLLKTVPSPKSLCTTTGWGYTSENGSISDVLMYVKLPIVSLPDCQNMLADVIHVSPALICAGYSEGGKDACQGDSGGPLICDNSLAGIVSGGRGCARPKLPGFYTSIPEYRTWVEQVMNSEGDNITYHGIINKPPSFAMNSAPIKPNASSKFQVNIYLFFIYLASVISFVFMQN